jgi:hypothetical protein
MDQRINFQNVQVIKINIITVMVRWS